MGTCKTLQKNCLAYAVPFPEVRHAAYPKDHVVRFVATNTKTQKSADLLANCKCWVGVVEISQIEGFSIGETFEGLVLLALLLKNVLSTAVDESLCRSICRHDKRTAKLLMKADQWLYSREVCVGAIERWAYAASSHAHNKACSKRKSYSNAWLGIVNGVAL